jgi:mannose-1-phosphate guanylyltransferase
MKALVLAAGYGQRLRPLTEYVPKPLMPVLNRPILAHVLERLRDAGLTDVAINTHWHGALVQSHIGSGERYGVRVTWFPEETLLGSVGTLRACRPAFGADAVLVTTADTISTFDVEGLVRQHERRRPAVTVAAAPVRPSWGGDRIRRSDEFTVAEYRYKPDDCDWHLGCFGMWIMEPWAVDQIPADARDFTSEALPVLAQRGVVEAFDGGVTRLTDVGELALLHDANMRSLNGTFQLHHGYHELEAGVFAPPGYGSLRERGVSCERSVVIGASATLQPGVRLVGPTVVGPGAVVEADSTVVDSVLLPGAHVTSGSLLSGAVFGHPVRMLPWIGH